MTGTQRPGKRRRAGPSLAPRRRGTAAAFRNGERVRAARWRIALAALLLCFGWQSFLAATHFHREPLGAAISRAADAGPGAPGLRATRPADMPATCPICEDLAQAGHYIAPAPIAWAAPAGVFAAGFALLLVHWSGRARSHAWRSRGPPHPDMLA